MVSVFWNPPNLPSERHLVVRAHRMGTPSIDKGYFYISDERDWGGSGPFDMRLDDVIDRAKQYASETGLTKIIVINNCGNIIHSP